MKKHWFFAGLLFLCFFLWFTPLNVLNMLSTRVKLLGTTGDLHHGGWQQIKIADTLLPLACQYQRQAFSLRYQVNCQAPFQLQGEVRLSLKGELSAKNVLITGSLSALQPWLYWLGVPGVFSGDLALSIPFLRLNKTGVHQLDLSGTWAQPALNQVVLFPGLYIKSEPQENDVRLTLSSNADPQSVQITQVPSLLLNSEIHGRAYQTTGFVNSPHLLRYRALLPFFGTPITPTQLNIEMQGQF